MLRSGERRGEGRGGVSWGHSFHEFHFKSLKIAATVVRTRFMTNKKGCFILFDAVSTEIQAHCKCVRSPDTPMSPIFVELTPSSPYRGMAPLENYKAFSLSRQALTTPLELGAKGEMPKVTTIVALGTTLTLLSLSQGSTKNRKPHHNRPRSHLSNEK